MRGDDGGERWQAANCGGQHPEDRVTALIFCAVGQALTAGLVGSRHTLAVLAIHLACPTAY